MGAYVIFYMICKFCMYIMTMYDDVGSKAGFESVVSLGIWSCLRFSPSCILELSGVICKSMF